VFASTTWNLVSFILSAVGALAGVLGALVMANGYYPGNVRSFLSSLPALLFSQQRREIAQKLASANPEDRKMTMGGICLIFVGFLLQLAGTFCAFMGTMADPSGK
jgi:hypothetical protein